VLLTQKTLIAAFDFGDILVTTWEASSAQQYSSSGTLLRTFTGTMKGWMGAALTPDGNLAVTYYGTAITYWGLHPGVYTFAPDGTQIRQFDIPTTSQYYYSVALTVFPDGVLAVTDTQSVYECSQTGLFVRRLAAPPGLVEIDSAAAAPDGTLWLADRSGHFVKLGETGTVLASFTAPNLFTERIAVAPDGSLYAEGPSADTYRLWSDGTCRRIFTTSGYGADGGMALASDGSFYMTSGLYWTQPYRVFHYTATGALLGNFRVDGDPSSLLVLPEPAPTAPLTGAVIYLMTRRHRRQRPHATGRG
jgi:hypothetical protein